MRTKRQNGIQDDQENTIRLGSCAAGSQGYNNNSSNEEVQGVMTRPSDEFTAGFVIRGKV